MNNSTAKIGNTANKAAQSISNSVNKQQSKSLGTNKAPKVPKGMPAHVAVEHGIRPPNKAGNAATTGQSKAYSLPN